jgi:hypothetical protein
MSVSVNIPDDLYRQAREIANAQRLSVDEVIASAFAEQVAAWERLKSERQEDAGTRSSEFSTRCPTLSLKSTIAFNGGWGLS